MKTSIPKLHSIRMKSGYLGENVKINKDWGIPDCDVDTVLVEAHSKKYRDIVIVGIRDDNTYEIMGSAGDFRITHYRLHGAAKELL